MTIALASPAESPPVLHQRTLRLLEGPVLPTLLRLAAPNVGEATARIAFIALDAVFVAWLGTEALAGVALVFPLFLVMQMMSAGGTGAGVSSAIARAMGAGRRADADALATQSLVLAVDLALVFALVMLLGGPWLYRAMSAEGAALEAALLYSNLVFGGGICVWLMNTLANVVRGTGNMAVPAGAIVASEAVHVALSPTLILGLGPLPALGLAGAAIAIVACYAAGAAILLGYILSGRAAVRFRAADLWPSRRHLADILKVGGPSALNVVQMQATMFLATGLVAAFGTAALAGYGAAIRLELIQIPILFAFGSAVIAMVATNIGAGRRDRARRIAWTGAAVSAVIGMDFAALALLLPETWMAAFTADPAVIAAGAGYLRTVGPAYPLLAVGLGLTFAAIGAGDAVRPFLAGTLRLAGVAAGGWAAVVLMPGSLFALFAAVALATAASGLAMFPASRAAIGR